MKQGCEAVHMHLGITPDRRNELWYLHGNTSRPLVNDHLGGAVEPELGLTALLSSESMNWICTHTLR